jgi:hypothetical protein
MLAERDLAHAAATAFAADLQATLQRKDTELAAVHRVLEQVRQSALGRMLLRAISKKG